MLGLSLSVGVDHSCCVREFAEPSHLFKESTRSQNHLRRGAMMLCVYNTEKGIFSKIEFGFGFDFDFFNFVNTRSSRGPTSNCA